MTYKLVGIQRTLKKKEKLITCEICGKQKISNKAKWTCCTRCSSKRMSALSAFKNKRGLIWSEHLKEYLNKSVPSKYTNGSNKGTSNIKTRLTTI